ncbi:hypothetical protein JMUB7499_27020 [Staphylococcus aureus]
MAAARRPARVGRARRLDRCPVTVARDPDRQCRGKNTYSTKAEAKPAIRNLRPLYTSDAADEP